LKIIIVILNNFYKIHRIHRFSWIHKGFYMDFMEISYIYESSCIFIVISCFLQNPWTFVATYEKSIKYLPKLVWFHENLWILWKLIRFLLKPVKYSQKPMEFLQKHLQCLWEALLKCHKLTQLIFHTLLQWFYSLSWNSYKFHTNLLY